MSNLQNHKSTRQRGFQAAQFIVISLLVSLLVMPVFSPPLITVSSSATLTEPTNFLHLEPTKFTLPMPRQADVEKPHTLAASYYSLLGNRKSTLTINHKGLTPVEVRPSLFNLAGQRLDLPPLLIEATSFQVFDLAEWAGLGDTTFQEGSLQLFYHGKDLLIGAQVNITDASASLIFDEQLTEPRAMFGSSQLAGLWWLPSRDSQLRIAISNTTDLVQTASLTLAGIVPKPQGVKEIFLEPHQTVLVDPQRDLADRPTAVQEAGAITITYAGKPGSLIATAVIENSTLGFSSALPLTDPLMAKSSSLHGAGLRIGEVGGESLTPVITAHNRSEKTAVLQGGIRYTKADGQQAVLPLRDVRLRAGEVKAWELSEVNRLRRTEIKAAGLEFDYDAPAGTVKLAAWSVSRSRNQVFQVPMLDAAVQKSSTGVYPFSFTEQSSTTVYIKNTTEVEQRYIAHLTYDEGQYQMGVKTLAAGETAALDLRALRDNQVADEEGHTLPADLSRGQIRWAIIQHEGTELLALIGRAEQIDEVRAISSSYACQNCCGDFAQDAFISPSQVDMQVGQSVFLQAIELRADCYGFSYPVPQSASWSSSNSSVASVSGGQVTPMRGGQVTITASWTSYGSAATQCNPGPGLIGPPEPTPCCREVTSFRSASAAVRVVPKIESLSPERALIGSTIDVTINGSGFGTTPTITVGGMGISVTRKSASDTKIVASFAIASNAGAGNHAVMVTSGGQSSNSVNFFVQIPSKIVPADVPGAPNGVGPLQMPVNDVVKDLAGNVQFNGTKVCGVYRNYAYFLVDQEEQRILQAFTIFEIFSNYRGPFPPPTAFSINVPANKGVSDIQFIGFPHPRCLGPNDNEEFRISYTVRIDQMNFD